MVTHRELSNFSFTKSSIKITRTSCVIMIYLIDFNKPIISKYMSLNFQIRSSLNIGSVCASYASLLIQRTTRFCNKIIRLRLEGYVEPHTVTQYCR